MPSSRKKVYLTTPFLGPLVDFVTVLKKTPVLMTGVPPRYNAVTKAIPCTIGNVIAGGAPEFGSKFTFREWDAKWSVVSCVLSDNSVAERHID